MRVLYDNKLETAENLTMTNLDNDTYVTNLYHPYLELAAVCLVPDSEITGSWTDSITIDSLSVAYHNGDEVTLTMYDDSGATLATEVITLDSYDNIYYFTAVSGVYSFKLSFIGGVALRVGFIFLGEYLELSNFNAGSEYPITFRSSASSTSGGQVYGNFARELKGYSVTWDSMTDTERKELKPYFSLVQTCKPHMVDLFHLSHDIEEPFYGVFDGSPDFKKLPESGNYYSLTLKYKEAR